MSPSRDGNFQTELSQNIALFILLALCCHFVLTRRDNGTWPPSNSAKRTGADDRVLEWNSGPEAEALEAFKTNKIQAGILAKVGLVFFKYLSKEYRCESRLLNT